MKYDLNAFEDMVKHGYLRKTENDDLVLYGYTDQCTFERAWQTKYTRDARGIIFEKKTGRLVAKPFPKFFNLGEMEEVSLLNLPKEPYEVFEKCDGSLGIIYYYGGKWNVATRGSLNSEQAIKGAEILKLYRDGELLTNFTYLVEIIYPENKIIVNYGNKEELILLAVYNTQTQEELSWGEVLGVANDIGMTAAKKYNYTIEQMIEMQKTIPKDEEGFVVRFESGVRVKIKGHEYLKIAKILSQMSPISAWEAMSDGKVGKEYLAQIPEELMPEFEPIVKILESMYAATMEAICRDLRKLPQVDFDSKEGKKTIGLLIQGKNDLEHPGAMFMCLNHQAKVLEKYIMKQIRPNGNALAGIE